MSFESMSVIINSEKERAKRKNWFYFISSLILFGFLYYLKIRFNLVSHIKLSSSILFSFIIVVPIFLFKTIKINQNLINSTMKYGNMVISNYSKYRDLNSYSENDKKILLFMEKYFFKYSFYLELCIVPFIFITNLYFSIILYTIIFIFYNKKLDLIETFLLTNSSKLGIDYRNSANREINSSINNSLDLSYVNLKEFGYKEFQYFDSLIIKKKFAGLARNLFMIIQLISILLSPILFLSSLNIMFFSFTKAVKFLSISHFIIFILFTLFFFASFTYLSYLNTFKIKIFADKIIFISYPFTLNLKGKMLYKSEINRFYFERSSHSTKGDFSGRYSIHCLYANNKSTTVFSGIFKEEEASDLCKRLNNEINRA